VSQPTGFQINAETMTPALANLRRQYPVVLCRSSEKCNDSTLSAQWMSW